MSRSARSVISGSCAALPMCRFALGQGRGHQHVFRAGDGDLIEENVSAGQAASARDARFHVAVRGADFRAHLFERLQVQVHGARADRAASRQGDARGTRARDQRPQREDRGAHGAHQFVGSFGAVDLLGLNGHGGGRQFGRLDNGAHMRQQLAHGDDVAHVRHVGQFHAVAGEQRRGHRRQRGILRPADAHRSFQRPSAFDQQFIHVSGLRLLCAWRRLRLVLQIG